jgi:hypothetical protein
MGEVPDWYVHLRAAKYLGVSPWELAQQPVFWRNAALVAEATEADVAKREQDRQART